MVADDQLVPLGQVYGAGWACAWMGCEEFQVQWVLRPGLLKAREAQAVCGAP